MTRVKRSLDLLADEKRKDVINAIIGYFKSERGEDIGVIAAGDLLDFVLEEISSDIYNTGVEDSLKFIRERFESMEPDMNALLKK